MSTVIGLRDAADLIRFERRLVHLDEAIDRRNAKIVALAISELAGLVL